MKISDLIDCSTNEYKWDIIETIPEFARLKECEQNPHWHSEGNAWNHTVAVCKMAQKYILEANSTEERCSQILLAAALFHDIGKGVTTEFIKGNWHSYGHEIKSEIITRRLLWDEDITIREYICSLVRWHMEPLRIFQSKNYISKIIELSGKVCDLHLLCLLKRFDILGSDCKDKEGQKYDMYQIGKIEMLIQYLNCYNHSNPSLKFSRLTIERYRIKQKPLIPVYMLIGISGAGKSTYIDKSLGEYPDAVVISRDIARIALGYCKDGEKYLGTKEEEEAVTDYCHKLLKDAATDGKTIIIDDMNIKRKYRDSVKEVLKEFNTIYHYVYIEADNIDKNIKRRQNQVPENVLYKMIESIEWPTYDEYATFKIERN